MRPVAAFLLAAVVVLSHTTAYGLTFDEARMIEDARLLGGWISGSVSTRAAWFGPERPSPAKCLVALGLLLGGPSLFWIRLFPALLYAASASCVYAVVRRPRGEFAAYAVLLALLIAPPFFACSAQASNESAVTALTLIGLSIAASARTRAAWIRAGVVAGLAVGTKISGLALLVVLVVRLLRPPPGFTSAPRPLALFALAAGLGFLATWPVLPIAPEAALDHVLHFASALPRPPTLYFGAVAGPSWHYVATWVLLGMPPLLLFFGALEILARSGPLARLLRLYLAVAVSAALVAHPFLREGLRHLLPLAAVIAVTGALGAGRLVERVPRFRLVIMAALGIPFLVTLFRLHPCESLYVTEAVGGPKTAVRWGLPVTSGGDVLAPGVLRLLPAGSYAVVSGGSSDLPLYFDSPEWRLHASAEASRIAGRRIQFTARRDADRWLILGSSSFNGVMNRGVGEALLERQGVVYVSLLENPIKAAMRSRGI